MHHKTNLNLKMGFMIKNKAMALIFQHILFQKIIPKI